MYSNIESRFFSDYIPHTYGGQNINSPTDRGLFMINFCIYPGTYQPSSHINVSRAREFYFKYTSSVIGTTPSELGVVASGTLSVVASAINFLLITDGSAVLRYST